MVTLLYIVLIFTIFAAIAVLLPVKFFLKASGGSDTGFDFDFRIQVYNGLLGGGIQSERHSYLFTVFIFSHGIHTVNGTKLISFISRKFKAGAKKKEEKKAKKIGKPKAEKKKWTSKLIIRLCKESFALLKWCIHEFHEMLEFDSVLTNIKLGLGYPHITGWIIGFLYTLNGVLPDKFIISPSWDFSRRIIQGDCTLQFTMKLHIFLKKIITSVPHALYMQREKIKYWYRVLKHENSIQEA